MADGLFKGPIIRGYKRTYVFHRSLGIYTDFQLIDYTASEEGSVNKVSYSDAWSVYVTGTLGDSEYQRSISEYSYDLTNVDFIEIKSATMGRDEIETYGATKDYDLCDAWLGLRKESDGTIHAKTFDPDYDLGTNYQLLDVRTAVGSYRFYINVNSNMDAGITATTRFNLKAITLYHK